MHYSRFVMYPWEDPKNPDATPEEVADLKEAMHAMKTVRKIRLDYMETQLDLTGPDSTQLDLNQFDSTRLV